MTAMNAVKSNLTQATQSVVDATTGLGGILTAPFATNRTTMGAVKHEAGVVVSNVFDLGVIPPLLVIWMLYTGGSEKSLPRRLGEGTFVSVMGYLALVVAREVVL